MDSIRFAVEDGIGRIGLNTDERNSFTLAEFRKLEEVLDGAAKSTLSALVIASDREGVFSQGLNLSELNSEESRKDLSPFLNHFFGILEKIYFFPSPVIAEVGGHAIGYGAMIAIASDFRMGLANLRMGLPEVKIGIRVPASVARMLANIVGWKETEQHIISGDMYKGSEAFEIGLLDEVYQTSSELKVASSKLAKKISKNSRSAVRASKEGMRHLNRELAEIFKYDKEKTKESLRTSDAHEGVAASITGRRPEFEK
ncbi:enoyl-CoA hydratase/isomerase family protein [Leptospira fletcheri]|nr:enoyl-CoA hydratase/isomerase family protein [Leptospira fletcheri]